MECASCRAENPAGNKFCGECGAALVLACAACGNRNPPSHRFCGECGARIEGRGARNEGREAQAQVPHSSPLAPHTYTPSHLADRIRASREALEGERKQVTVLFADVVGSTELIRDLDPEEARSLLEPAVSAMIDAVHRFEGTVCRVMGDGLMALFGAPLAHEDHAARASYAALTMQEAIRAYGEAARARAGVELNARVGLNSGEVVVGSISNDLYVEYSAIGPTTHLAARMEQLAVPGTIRLTAETVRLVDALVEVRSLGKIPVRGLAEPIEAFELLGAGASRRRFQAAAARGLTPFVGRLAELDALQRALDLARGGHGQVVAPVGEPGVGKSRLLYEFVHSERTREWLVLESGSVSYGKATSYLPVIDLLKSYCRIEPRDDARAVREKLTGKLLALDPALSAILPPLLALLDLPVDDTEWAALDPAGRRRVTLEGLRRLLLRESQEQPLLLVFEDLHWIDAETQALLDSLVEALPTARVLLLVNYRPEYTHSWGNKSYYTQLRIDPLGEASADELLTALLGDHPSVEPLKALLIGRTDGNPFFLEESVRTLVETGALAGERGAHRLTGPLESVRVPATVQAVLAARIDRLPAADKRLLQTAAVIGKDVPFMLLQRIAETPDAELQAGLSRLQAAELLYAVSLFPELELTFKHALTHEVAYSGLLQERRRALHARIVEAIEALYPDRLDEQVERLAHHALRGQLWHEAATYLCEAGSRALRRAAWHDAIGHFEQAVAALDHLPRSQENVELAIDLRFDLRGAYWAINDFDRSYAYLREAEALAKAAGDRRRLGWVAAYVAHYLRATVDHQRAVEAGGPAIQIAIEMDDLRLRVAATDVVAQSYHEMGQLPTAIALLQQSLAWIEEFGEDVRHRHNLGPTVVSGPAVVLRSVLAYCLSWQGNFKEATAWTEDLVRIAESTGLAGSPAFAHQSNGLVYSLKGAVPAAVASLEHALDLTLAQGRRPHPAVHAFLGYGYLLAGRADEAVDLLERSLERSSEIRWLPCVSLWSGWLAGAYLGAGRLADADTAGLRAIDMTRAHREHGFEGYALRQMGDIVAAGEPPDTARAEELYHQALAIGEKLGMRPLQAECHFGLGKLYRRAGRDHEARSALNIAVDLCLSMEMTHWLPEAEAELAALGA